MAITRKPKEEAAPAAKPAMLQVTGPAKGRWRSGRYFGPEMTVFELADLTDDEISRLKADPELTVIEVEATAPVDPAA